jgi:hypothetical protein
VPAGPARQGYWLELQVDQSGDAVTELAKKYAELTHDAKGPMRPARTNEVP